MKSLFAICLTIISSLYVTHSWAVSIQVEGAYVRHTPPTQKVSGAFMTIINSSHQNRAVVSAESSVAETVELHTHEHDDGVMRMRQVNQIDLPADAKVALKPGGFHIMLIDVKAPLKLDQIINIQLNFDDGSHTQVQAPVKSILAGMKLPYKKMDNSKMKQDGMDHSKMKGMSN